MRLEDMGLIGNCQYAALVHRSGDICWCCWPRFDSEPLFGSLLDAERGGHFSVSPVSGELGQQSYIANTNVLITRFDTESGSFRIIDLAPRFLLHGRSFRPVQLFRIIEPLAGRPVVRVSCKPLVGWSRATPGCHQGSNHLQFEGFSAPLRLTTDVPLSYLEGQPFALTEKKHLALAWGEPVEKPLPGHCHYLLEETVRYWQRWVKHCTIPPDWQNQVIRSALALKLCCYEDTGAIVAAITTSIPEAPKSGRTWDYRYCWLRDAYYVISALRRIGHFEEAERFVHYLLDIATRAPNLELQPLYRIDGGAQIDEHVLEEWPGYSGDGPVRVGNAAATHRQHDVFGEMVLALEPIFLDERFREERNEHTLELLGQLARKAEAVAGTPDAGIWEYRAGWTAQTFSSLMCWVALDRVARIFDRHRVALADELRAISSRIHRDISERAFSEHLRSFASTYGGSDFDASLLQMVTLRFLPPDDPRLVGTVERIRRELAEAGWLFRYKSDDGFGRPRVAFVICTFWLVEALARMKRMAEARALFDQALQAAGPLGLLAEDFDPHARRMWGNFPQAYSHVGLIHGAFSASRHWYEVL
jgi:GH15 family glucan-1,4-alpha-glucosidase